MGLREMRGASEGEDSYLSFPLVDRWCSGRLLIW